MYQPSKDKSELHNNSMTALLELYPHWLIQEMDLSTPNITLLLMMCPSQDNLNKANLATRKPDFPMMRNEGQFENVESEVNCIDAFVPETIRFGYFVEGVMKGDINVDKIPAFRQHMMADWEESVGSWAEKAEEYKQIEEFANYKLPDIFAEEKALEIADAASKPKKSKGSVDPLDKDCHKFSKLMKDVFLMKGTEGIEQKFAEENITEDDLKEAVVDCFENELVEKVVLNSKKTFDHWVEKWDETEPFKTPELAKKLQVMVLHKKSTTPKKRKRKDGDGDEQDDD